MTDLSRRINALIAAEHLPATYRDTIERWWQPLAANLAATWQAAGHPLVIGINGPQGSGKSTLALALALLLEGDHGLNTAILSLDDLYATRAERLHRAATIHPLLSTRGVPGTHDVVLGIYTINALITPDAAAPVALPRFDKGRDDRADLQQWPHVAAPADIVLFEGWCIGATSEEEAMLRSPINALEAGEDHDGVWRRHVNDALAGPYRALFGMIDSLIMLQPPSFDQVREWRILQEHKLRARRGELAGMTDQEVIRFIAHFERLTRHMLHHMPQQADIVFTIDADHRIVDRVKG